MRTFFRTTATWVLVAFVGDTLVAPLIAFGEVAPDFSVIALVILALAGGPFAGCVGGFALGLVQDLATPHLLGLGALCKSGLGYTVGQLRRHLVYGLPVVEGVVVALAVLAHDTLYLLVQSQLGAETFLEPWLLRAVPIAIYSGLVGIPLIRAADGLGLLRPED